MAEPWICGCILTYNEAHHIAKAVNSLAWCDEVLVWDSFCTDDTAGLDKAAGANVVKHPFSNYAQQRNAALSHVLAGRPTQGEKGWLFFLDADERCTAALAKEMRQSLVDTRHRVWYVPRDNFLFGRLTRHAGWYPDHQARVLLLGGSRFDPQREVHEVAQFEGEPGYLKSTLTHYNYASVAQFHAKQVKYSAYDASILFKQGVHVKPQNFILQPMREFWRRFVRLQGYKMGWHGLRLSWLCMRYNLSMYVTLAGLWKKANGRN